MYKEGWPQSMRARHTLSNGRRKSTVCFERPAEQVLVLATEPQAKQEARSILCHTCQQAGSDVQAEQERRHCTLSWSRPDQPSCLQ